MLKRLRRQTAPVAPAATRFAIIASEYNARYVDGMLRAARAELKAAGAAEVKVLRVPGAFEIPVVAGALARQWPRWDGVICLGVILQGETSHAEHVGTAVTHALATLAVETGVPMIHEVLVFTSEEQARIRCLGKDYNRGAEAARTALKLTRVMAPLVSSDVPF